ncbi:MAG: hypothetical protein EOR16_31025 [Mesorhizobium sp.]|nr:MAG: hypothetical protein EOR16_31025 [Mesorhizobium sp.]
MNAFNEEIRRRTYVVRIFPDAESRLAHIAGMRTTLINCDLSATHNRRMY